MEDLMPDWMSYLSEPSARYGADWRRWAFEGAVERCAAAWRELAGVHDAIRQREDLPAIGAWLRQGQAPIDPPRRRVYGLLRLVTALGDDGVKPFDQPVLRLPPSTRSSAVRKQTPPRLHYLLRLARRLHLAPNDARLRRFIDEVSPSRFNDLARVADAIRRRDDRERIRCWLAEHDPRRHRAAAIIAGLMRVMDELEIF